ncbi:Energy-coupling factor transporter transmembrane protein EcfT [Jeotgalicoccus saudimassiliensis]|uniref:Energy-coupling factor transporter transmembrane protein EcfT n=1 Tax=Jeotgalicoccus saudimassiliensis TaxID=1461582 RepID=A0A078M565_9STAP|nr:energy-coupling factor transporter transmembrane protein EcfT [Jeotgalicoccus saudimassiliensis]CEA01359.1 Energy-coupling factor transporter transmembrane protein EcfT [Jeotgalicoccus saudimassiliensis]
MLSSMLLGRYIPGNSIIHMLDPRAKIISVIMFMVIVFFANHWVGYSLLILFVLLVTKLAGLSVRFLFNGLKLIFILLIFTFLMHIFLTKGGTVLIDGGFFTIESKGLITGIYITVRLIMLVVITTLMTLTTSPIELTDAIEKLCRPLKTVKVPVHEIAMMMSISLRFIPTLMDETEKIIKAQSARGSTFLTGSLKQRINALVPIFIPLFMSAFKRAEEMAIAMEVRGYQGEAGRTHYRLLTWQTRDTVTLIVLVLFGALLLFVRQ